MAKYFGTPIPTEGVVEKVYFNNELSGKEVNIILNTIEFQDQSNWNLLYIIAVNKEDNTALILQSTRDRSNNYVYIVDENNNFTVLFELQNWVDNKGQVDLNFELSTTSEYFHSDAEIGTQNYKLASLFSITPFEVEKNILMHPKDEIGKMNANISLFPKTLATNLMVSGGKPYNMPNVVYQKSSWDGEKVPNSGLIGDIYLNTQLSKEEVIEIISKLEYENDPDQTRGDLVYRVISDEEYDAHINIYFTPTGHYKILITLYDANQYIFDTEYCEDGWDFEILNDIQLPLQFNKQAVESYEAYFGWYLEKLVFGLQNEKIKGLFSLSPSFKTKEGLFESKEDGKADETKPIQTGISEERVNELIDEKIGNFLGGES